MYRRGEAKDKQDILDFINYVFCHASEPIDFRRLLPKAYAEDCDKEDIHHMIVEEDRIKAIIGVYPGVLEIAGHPIKTGYIGSVSVHPYARGSGYMKILMEKAKEQMQADGCELTILSGQRQRYEHFGYYRGGQKYQYNVSSTNLRHYFLTKKNLSIEELESSLEDMEFAIKPQTSNYDDYMDAIYEIYLRRLVTGRSREDFFAVMKSYDADLYAITMHDVCIGYASMNYEEDHINELELVDMSFLPYAIYALYQYIGITDCFVVSTLLEREKNKILQGLCERYTLGQAQMYHINDYPLVMQALLEAKNKVKKLPDGSAVIKILNQDKIKLEISQDGVKVTKTEERPSITVTEEQCIRILLSTGFEQAVFYEEVEGLEELPNGWFPLPLCIPEADTF